MTKQALVLIIVLLYVLLRSFFIEPNSLDVVNYKIESKYLSGVRVAFLSDLHLKKNDYKRLNKIAMLANKQNPDIIILGGDYFSGQDYKKSMNAALIGQKFSMFNIPVFAVLGEQDWLTNGESITDDFYYSGVEVLENSNKRTVLKGRYVDIIGFADKTTRGVDIEKAFYHTMRPRILVTHNPDVYYDIMEDVDLILAGHTHGGQFILPFTPPLFVPSKFGAEFASGLINSRKNKMIISKGIGTSVVPIRLNCKPEIVIVDFVPVGSIINEKAK